MMPETVTVTTAEFLRLLESDLALQALRAAGVDNWPGYDEIDWDAVQDGVAGARAALGDLVEPSKPTDSRGDQP
jgi:hypothetical protein